VLQPPASVVQYPQHRVPLRRRERHTAIFTIQSSRIYTCQAHEAKKNIFNHEIHEKTRKKRIRTCQVLICKRLNFPAQDNRRRFTEALDTMQVLYFLQIVPSKEANPYRLWLAEAAAAGINVADEIERLAEKNAAQASGLMKQTVTTQDMMQE